MDKTAKSTDPVQEALRQKKRVWNNAAKIFIKRLIGFKKGLNGRGDPDFGLPISNIKDPLPSEIGSFLHEVTANFELLVQEAIKIEQAQLNYSETRRKAVPKVATASTKETQLSIAGIILPTVLAISAEEQERGLMYQELPIIMSFVYNEPQINRFWMKNTAMPLDIIFSINGKITNIHKGEPFSTRLIGDFLPSDLVVEMPYGSVEKMGIKIGDDINLKQIL